MFFGQVGKEDRRAVGKLGNDVHLATHGFDGFSQRGEQQVAAFFKPRDAVLGDPESLGNAGLRKLAGLSQVAQAHFLGNEFSRTVLDLLSLGWAQLPNDFIHIYGQFHCHSMIYNPYGVKSISIGVRILSGWGLSG